MEWGISLHQTGPYQGLPEYEPQLLSAKDGQRITIVATVEVRDSRSGNGHLCRGVVTGQRFRLIAEVPPGVRKVTVMGGQVTHLRCPIVKVDSQAGILHHREKELAHMFQFIETCSGLGALGLGAKQAGWTTQVHNELMKSFSDHLQKFSSIKTIHGDICKLSTVAAIHDCAPQAASMAFGFSCQPFSRLGDRREGQDPRSQSLPFGLYAAFLLQLDLVVTECVPEASQSPFVLKCMQQYMQMTNSDRSEALLELADVWPSRRRRWWSVLLKSFMGKVRIPPFPKLSAMPTIACLLPGALPMTDQEIEELTLSTEERMMFERYGKGLGGHMINMTEPLATALHSWANQCVDCACGCRGPLSCNRLQAQGIYGVLVHMRGRAPDKNVRHLSAREMALLTGFPKTDGWTDHQRLLAAGVGQLASPLQSAWVFSSILNHLIEHGFFQGDLIPPTQVLACVAADVFKLRDEWYQDQRTVTIELFQETIEKFLEPVESAAHAATPFQELTPSQDADLAQSIASIEIQAQAKFQAGQCSKAADSNAAMPTELTPGGSAIVEECQESTNSQRTGRKDLEEKQNGETQKQPACGPPEPDKNKDKQPASGPQEPDKRSEKQPAVGAQEPSEVGRVPDPTAGQSGPNAMPSRSCVQSFVQPDMSIVRVQGQVSVQNQPIVGATDSSTSQPRVSSFVQPEQPDVRVPGQTQHQVAAMEVQPFGTHSSQASQGLMHGGSGLVTDQVSHPEPGAHNSMPPGPPCQAIPDQQSSLSVPSSVQSSAKQPVWDQTTGAIQAFATALTAPTTMVKKPVMQAIHLPPEVCFSVSEVLTPGLFVYDADTHQICKHHHAPDATVQDWIRGLEELGIQYPCMSDMMGRPLDMDMQLLSLRWIIVSHLALPAQDMLLHDRAFAVESLPRHESLLLQGGAVAMDEMMYYLSAVDSVGVAKSWKPLVIHSLTDLHSEAVEWLGDLASYAAMHDQGLQAVATQWWAEIPIEAVATLIWVNHHWIPIWLVPGTRTYAVTTTDEGKEMWKLLFPTWEGTINVQKAIESAFSEDCGFQAFAWLVSQCTYTTGMALSATEATGWRQLYWQQVLIRPPKKGAVILGGHSELETALQALLRDHGVFPDRVQERAAQVLKSLSHSAVAGAFKAARPWQQLKQLASNATPSLRLVMEEELQATIKARTRQKGSIKAKGVSKGRQAPPVHLHPQDINIPHGIFRLETGELLPQLSAKQIGQNAKGVVAFTEEEVQPYLKHVGSVGQGLGFLVLSPYSEATASSGEVHRFPVQSKVTGEPVLISAVLLQCSPTQVVRNVPQKAPAIDQIPTQTIKVLVYRDQTADWDEVIKQPVKYIISQVTEFQICREAPCQCLRWHPTEQTDSAILDVWQRDFLTIHFQKTKATESQLFAVSMRVPSPVFQVLFRRSGQDGIYFEPRTEDGRGQAPEFHTIWIPRKPFSEVVALQSMQETTVSLVRVGARYGFKVPEAEATTIHEKVNPGDPYIAGPHRMVYHVGPFPWGTTKKAIQQLFQQWGWTAKAIHSATKAMDSSGLMWLVHAAAPPGHLVYQLQHGDVIIHQKPSQPKEVWRPPQAQASSKEIQSKVQDEVFINDPWAASAKQLTHRSEGSANWSSLEAAIDQKIAQKLDSQVTERDELMQPSVEPRLQALEHQVAQLQQRSVQLDGKVDFLHQQVEQQSKKFESALDNKLSEQMHRIEMLMSKRARSQE